MTNSIKKMKLTLVFIVLTITIFSCDNKNEKSETESLNTSETNLKDSDTTNFEITENKVDNELRIKHEAYKSDILNLPISLNQFIPSGYTAIDTLSGDLNSDDYNDMLLVYKKNGEDSTSNSIENPEKRTLIILIGQPDKTYKLVAQNRNVVYCVDCFGGTMGDSFMGLVIKNGYFSIEHYGGSIWRTARTITFKYSKIEQNWFLHKDGIESFHATDENEKKTTEIKTKKDFGIVPFEKFDIYKEN